MSFKEWLENDEQIPDVWLNRTDEFEGKGVDWHMETLLVKEITEVAWTVTQDRQEIERAFMEGKKMPLVLVESQNGVYKLHDGQHRFAAYKNVFPNERYIKVAVFTSS